MTDAFANIDIILFIFCGAVCGVAGAGFVHAVRYVMQHARPNLKTSFQAVGATIAVAAVIALVSYPLGRHHSIFTGTQSAVITDLFNANPHYVQLGTAMHPSNDDDPDHHISLGLLLLFVVYKAAVTVFSVNLPIPAGCFAPVFAIGAAMGRILGALLHEAVPANTNPASEGEFSMVCAAAFAAAVTHTISPAVLVMELTSQANNILGSGIAVLVAYRMARFLAPSIYRSHDIAGIPHFESDVPADMDDLTVSEIMDTDICPVFKDATALEVMRMLKSTNDVFFPLVVSREDFRIEGDVDYADLAHFVVWVAEQKGREQQPAAIEQLEGGNSAHLTLGHYLELPQRKGRILRHHLTVPHNALVEIVGRLFEVLSPSCVYVTDKGTLVGTLARRRLVMRGWKGQQEKHNTVHMHNC